MKILHVLWSASIGGTERSLYLLLREQSKGDRDEVAVLFAQGHGHYFDLMRRAGCTVASADLRSGRDVTKLPRLIGEFRRYDTHHFHSVEPLLFLASLLSGRKTRVFTERAGTTDRRRPLRDAIGRLLLRRFDGFSANTAFAARLATRRHGVPFSVTYNGVDFSLLRPEAPSRVREDLGIPEGCAVIGTVAHLKPWKRIDRLLEASARLDGVEHRILIVGDGPDRPRLEGRTRQLGLEDRVTFAGSRERVADHVAAMDAFVLPSNGVESFGNAAVEAMGLGVPVVVFSDSPGLCEHIEPGRTGFIVSDVDELCTVLRDLAADPPLRQQVGRRAARAVRSRYRLGEMAAAYDRLYRSAAGGGTGHTAPGGGVTARAGGD